MEYKRQTRGTGDFEEIVGELQITSPGPRRDFSGVVEVVKENAHSFVGGLIVGLASETLDIYTGLNRNNLATGSSITGLTAVYVCGTHGNLSLALAAPGFFIGVMLSQYLTRQYAGK